MIAPEDFSLKGGELTPTMKLKRHVVEVGKYLEDRAGPDIQMLDDIRLYGIRLFKSRMSNFQTVSQISGSQCRIPDIRLDSQSEKK